MIMICERLAIVTSDRQIQQKMPHNLYHHS